MVGDCKQKQEKSRRCKRETEEIGGKTKETQKDCRGPVEKYHRFVKISRYSVLALGDPVLLWWGRKKEKKK